MSRRYDHRIRNAIVKSGNPRLFPELDIPASTIRDWLRKGPANVITTPEFERDNHDLIAEIINLKDQLAEAQARAQLITTTVNILGFQLQYKRVPNADIKLRIIDTIKQAAIVIGLDQCLEAVQLSKARFTAWLSRQKTCTLDDRKTCGKLSPTRLLVEEVSKIKDLIMDPTLRHFSITSLALFAKRENLVHASVSTWHRVVRHYKLRRPGHRRYPLKPKVGIRASAPGQILHLDQTVIKLKDGTRCFIQSVLDNFSRYVLAWQITRSYGGVSTKALILSALQKARSFGIAMAPQVIADGGSENLNKHVDALVDEGVVTRTIAQVEVDYSNSMIEALFLRVHPQNPSQAASGTVNSPLQNFFQLNRDAGEGTECSFL